MDKKQVLAVMGKAFGIIQSSNNKARQIWVYLGIDQSGVNLRRNIYCYFENGVLIGSENEVKKNIREYNCEHPELLPNCKNALSENKILIGMNTEQIRLILGEPANINKIKKDAPIAEEWFYDNPLYLARYLYFEDNILKSWRSE